MRWFPLKLSKGILCKPGKGLFLLALLLAVLAPASFSPLHLAIHPDAGSTDHQCVVNLLSSGQVDSPPNEVALIILPVFETSSLPETPLSLPLFRQFPPGRGPPANPS